MRSIALLAEPAEPTVYQISLPCPPAPQVSRVEIGRQLDGIYHELD